MSPSSHQILPPCFGQTAEEIEKWLRANVAIGTVVAIRNTQAGFLQYVPARIIRIGKGRFEVAREIRDSLSGAGNTFYYSGKNCWQPKGQTRLVIPSPDVINAYGSPGDLGLTYGPYTV